MLSIDLPFSLFGGGGGGGWGCLVSRTLRAGSLGEAEGAEPALGSSLFPMTLHSPPAHCLLILSGVWCLVANEQHSGR